MVPESSKTWPIPYDHDDATRYFDRLEDELKKPCDEVSDLETLLIEADPELFLEQIATGAALSAYSANMISEDDGMGLPQRLMEYVLGLFVVVGSEGDSETNYHELAKLANRVSSSIAFVGTHIDPSTSSEEEIERAGVEFSSLLREVTVGRFTMSNQPIEAARRAYEPHKQQMENKLGFNINDAIVFTQLIEEVYSSLRMWMFDKSGIELSDVMRDEDTTSSVESEFKDTGDLPLPFERNDLEIDSEIIEHVFDMCSENRHALWFTEKVLAKRLPDDYNEGRLRKFLERMSISVGNVSEPIFKDFKYPYQANPVHKYPIIEFNGRYMLPIANSLRYALFETFYYDLQRLPNYGDPTGETGGEFGDVFGDYLEEWTYDCLVPVFGEDSVYLNPRYPDSGEEAADLVVIWKNRLFVFECKIGKLPIETRQGNFEDIKSSIESKAGHGYRQAMGLVNQIKTGHTTKLDTSVGVIDVSQVTQFRPIIILGEPYDMFATTQLGQLIDIDGNWPNIIDIFDLQVVTNALEYSPRVVDYLTRRAKISKKDRIISSDECDYLGLYISEGYTFKERDEGTMEILKDYSDTVRSHTDPDLGF